MAQTAAPVAASAAPDACATEQPEATSAANSVQTSQRYLRCAVDRFRERDYRLAIRYFELANSAAPSADFQFNIARAHELLSEYEPAADHYERYLRDKLDAPDRADVQRRIVELRDLARRRREAERRQDPRAFVQFEVDPRGAEILVEGRSIGRSPIARPLELPVGTHTVTAQLDGYRLWQGIVRPRQSDTVIATIRLEDETRFRTIAAPHIASYVIGGVGVASLVGAIVAAVAIPGGVCFGPRNASCTGVGGDRIELANNAHQVWPSDGASLRSTLSGALVGVGVAALSGAAIAWFIEAAAGRTERVPPRVRETTPQVALATDSATPHPPAAPTSQP